MISKLSELSDIELNQKVSKSPENIESFGSYYSSGSIVREVIPNIEVKKGPKL